MEKRPRRDRLQSEVGTRPQDHQMSILAGPPKGQFQRMMVGPQPHGSRLAPALAQRLPRHNDPPGDLQLNLAAAENEEAIIAARRDKQMALPGGVKRILREA